MPQDHSLELCTCLMMTICRKEGVSLPLQPVCVCSRRIPSLPRDWEGREGKEKGKKGGFRWFSSFLSCYSPHPSLLWALHTLCRNGKELCLFYPKCYVSGGNSSSLATCLECLLPLPSPRIAIQSSAHGKGTFPSAGQQRRPSVLIDLGISLWSCNVLLLSPADGHTHTHWQGGWLRCKPFLECHSLSPKQMPSLLVTDTAALALQLQYQIAFAVSLWQLKNPRHSHLPQHPASGPTESGPLCFAHMQPGCRSPVTFDTQGFWGWNATT